LAGAEAASCVALVGPTAVGKTDLVLALGRDLPLEVISLDSRQIYRGLRIGTAQPSAAELAVCPHHLVDFLPPEATYSAQRYREDFATAWRDVTARGAVPLLVGGAGLYLRALIEGFFELPPGSQARLPAVRLELEALSRDEIRRRLHEADPVSWGRIHPHDRYRSQRALEVTRLAGRPMSSLIDEHRARPALGLAFRVFVLQRPVADLDARIVARTAAMLQAGWLEETRSLLEDHAPDCPGLESLGYRQVVAHLRGDLDRSAMVEAIVRETRQYAKRQRTWFRQVARAGEGLPEDPALRQQVLAALREGLS